MMIGHHNTASRVFVIAEIGNNHEGSRALAEDLIGRAALAGVDAVKFQTIVPERLVARTDERRLAQLRRFQLSYDDFRHLATVAQRAGVLFLSTPFDCESAAFLDALVPAYKVASGDLTFLPMIEVIAHTGKPVIFSTGAATVDEIRVAVAHVQGAWAARGVSGDHALLHCVASYPVPPGQANLGAISTLREQFPHSTIGYSDHTMGNDAAVAAVAIGARIVEKHFTLAHDYSDFRDHQLSATPDEIRVLVERIRAVELMMGSGVKVPQPCEEVGRSAFRRAVVAAEDLPEGIVLSAAHLTWVRPAGPFAPGQELGIIGKRLRRAVVAGTVLDPQCIEECMPERSLPV
ncbi:MAG: N-acetylneuraminate synthase family protein [bacterium]|nr:N-acetylneuraminate synthase family protein [bacterium]